MVSWYVVNLAHVLARTSLEIRIEEVPRASEHCRLERPWLERKILCVFITPHVTHVLPH